MTSGTCKTCGYISRLGRCQNARSEHYAELRLLAGDQCDKWSVTRFSVPRTSGHITATPPLPERKKVQR